MIFKQFMHIYIYIYIYIYVYMCVCVCAFPLTFRLMLWGVLVEISHFWFFTS